MHAALIFPSPYFAEAALMFLSKGPSLIHMERLLFPAVLREPALHMRFLPTDRCYTYCRSEIPKSPRRERLVIQGCSSLLTTRGLRQGAASQAQVEALTPAGTLMLLLMTANTLMLYSTPASRPEMLQLLLFPGIRISSCTPDRETERQVDMHERHVEWTETQTTTVNEGSARTSRAAGRVGHQDVRQHHRPLPLHVHDEEGNVNEEAETRATAKNYKEGEKGEGHRGGEDKTEKYKQSWRKRRRRTEDTETSRGTALRPTAKCRSSPPPHPEDVNNAKAPPLPSGLMDMIGE
ncbi:hypothetical protein EYF80_052579 [Liparis tanakae]|uniref:Uncharacterized protein n=1 Tax=Liparis tanakae TaxID=230148 RepID=A0A4Z2F8V3_9TELE|nr:hypothetical protein EYF80_052579 [Liparis tanakae]